MIPASSFSQTPRRTSCGAILSPCGCDPPRLPLGKPCSPCPDQAPPNRRKHAAEDPSPAMAHGSWWKTPGEAGCAKGIGTCRPDSKTHTPHEASFQDAGIFSIKRSRHCVPGWDESSRWDGEGEMCIKTRRLAQDLPG